MSRLSASSARDKRVARRKRPIAKRHKIDFSDIPELSDAQLRVMRRVGRPPLGEYARQFSELPKGSSLTIPVNPPGWYMTLVKK